MACSQTLNFLFRDRRAYLWKMNDWEFIVFIARVLVDFRKEKETQVRVQAKFKKLLDVFQMGKSLTVESSLIHADTEGPYTVSDWVKKKMSVIKCPY